MGRNAAQDEALTAFVQVRARYRRAMNLERDTGRPDALTGYLVTPIVRRALTRIASGLGAGGTERAWSLTGPYGSGKTAFAVFLSSLFGRPGPLKRNAQRVLREVDAERAQSLRKITLLPIVLTGERAPLDLLLVRALKNALEAEWSTRRGAKPAVLAEALRLEERLGRAPNGCVTSEVVACFERAIRCVADATGAGLLLIIDEAGKILEFAAQNPTRGDVQLFQALAELAAGSGAAPFSLVTVLHQAFDEYAARLAASQRNEWAKVQGRFSDLIFQEEPDQLVRLIAAAIEPVRKRPAVPAWKELVEAVAEWVSQGTGWDRKALAENLDGCWPLHPVTAVLLGPLFRGRLAQNERSLFAFLSSGEPLGFYEFLKAETARSLYTPDRLYDYVLAALGNGIFGRDGKLWAEIDTALRRLPPEAEALDAKVVKVAGLLTMLGDYVGLRPSAAVIEHALLGERDVTGAIERLQAASLLIYRKFRDAYQVWEGSDLDLEEVVKEARDQLVPGQPLAPLLMRLVPPRPLIARRHLFHTGTLRYFEVRFVDGEAFAADPASATREEPLASGADGIIILALPASEETRADLGKRLTEGGLLKDVGPNGVPVVVVLPSSTAYLGDLAWELAALERAETTTPALQSDLVARKELASRISETQQLLEQEVARVFAADNPDCEWYAESGRLPVRTSRELMGALSDLFDLAYSQAPPIRNELLNRRELSSAAAKARRNLLEAMILKRDELRLGFAGYPPEVSMYRSVLEEHGFHRQVEGKWRFVAPNGSMRSVWATIETFLDETEQRRLTVVELYERLKRPPFGIKDGPLPVLLCAALLCRESEVALYEQGSLVPELSAQAIERLLRKPERFEVRQSRIVGVRFEVFERLTRSIVLGGKPSKTVLEVVRGLMRFLSGLPNYARNTATLSPEAIRVRETLLRTREPAQLLFAELPVACGCRPFEAETRVAEAEIERFFATLRRSLNELQSAYPHLLAQVAQALATTLGLPPIGDALRTELRGRAKRVYPLAVEPLLRGFLVRATDEGLEHEEWLVSLATYLASKPPSEWSDRDQDQFNVQLAVVARRFRSLEAMALAEAGPDGGTRLVRVAVARQGAIEQEGVVAVRENEMQLLAILRDRIMATVDDVSEKVSRDTVVAALALVTEHLLADAESAPVATPGGRE
jgi:hypothetical protein